MTLLICPANDSEGKEKDTLRNCKPVDEGGIGQFVVNVASEAYIRQVAGAAEPLPYGESEFELTGLIAVASTMVKPPRVAESPLAFECETLQVIRTNPGAPAGGNLVLELWNSDPDTEEIDEVNDVEVSIDGIVRAVPAGGKVILEPGESITLPPYLYHRFYGEAGHGMVLAGEVSRVNDDERDNRFNPPLPRFSEIEEDEPPRHLLCMEYPPAE